MKPKLLIIDDEEAILFAGEAYFTGRGYAVDCARERRDAEVLLEHNCGSGACYTAVIADLRIRGVSDTEGLDILAYVKKRCPSALRILLTAYGSPEIERRACELSIDILLHKPKPLAEIAQILSGFIPQRSLKL
ncbi:MAG: response regulator [Pyrinomonadaceae bacterium]